MKVYKSLGGILVRMRFAVAQLNFGSAMQMIVRGIPLIAILVFMAGCVTHPPASLVQPWPQPPPDGYAMLMMYCDNGGARGPSVFIDDMLVFKIRGDCYLWTYVPAGKHALHTRWGFLMNSLNGNKDIQLEAGKEYYLKLAMATESNPLFVTIYSGLGFVPEERARKEAAACWLRKAEVPEIERKSQAATKY